MEIQAFNVTRQYFNLDGVGILEFIYHNVRLYIHFENVVSNEFICEGIDMEA